MQWTSLNDLREKYLAFFESKNHLRLPSYPLVPINDPSLLLINSGMAPMKKFFTGEEIPPRNRVCTCQKCIRTPDLERVGHTARHGTFFEMLGNFSFGDYFKNEAIPWAWEFLTVTLEIPENLLWPSIYEKDEEAYHLWADVVGVPAERIVRLGKADNFWEHGSGPCGPCSEIYFDRGEARGCGSPDCKPGCDCDRFMEIWNNVFSQFNNDGQGNYTELAQKNIDTGMGLERLACVMQDVDNMFLVDTNRKILDTVSQIAGKEYGADKANDVSIRVCTDHIKSAMFMIADGVIPSNEGRGYVLRRIIRRACRHGKLLGIDHPFLTDLCKVAMEQNCGAYPELSEKAEYILKVLTLEEERFDATIDAGLSILNTVIEAAKVEGKTEISGDDAFKLYDTFGFPWELTEEILHENDMELDKEAFDKEMQAQRDRARAARAENERYAIPDLQGIDTAALKVDLSAREGKVVAIWKDGALVDELQDGDEAGIILDVTPFYAEGGGQVGDKGVLVTEFGRIQAVNAKKLPDGTVYHECYVEEGQLKVGDKVEIKVDQNVKLASARNHTATHLLQAALKRVVGQQVNQAGSSVNADRLRFDFTNFEPVSAQQLADVEELVNREILKGTDVVIEHMSKDEATGKGAMALFGEKYGDVVRVVSVPGFSMELCGGSHVTNVGQIGLFKIISETGVAAGVRRIEAITGQAALDYAFGKMKVVAEAAAKLKCHEEDVIARVDDVLAQSKDMQQQLAAIHAEQAKADAAALGDRVQSVGAFSVIAARVAANDMDDLRSMADMTCDKLDTGVVVLAAVNEAEGKVSLVVKASKAAVAAGAHAGKVIKEAAKLVGGGGGGRPDMAQAGGKNPAGAEDALAKAVEILASQSK